MRLDPGAESARSDLPAFLAPPDNAPVYHGFGLVEATRTDGWCYGAITEHLDADGCDAGDGFVQAPDGSRAGLAWSVGSYPTRRIIKPTKDRWGVYAISFPKTIRTDADLTECFRAVLPELKDIYHQLQASRQTFWRRLWPFGRR